MLLYSGSTTDSPELPPIIPVLPVDPNLTPELPRLIHTPEDTQNHTVAITPRPMLTSIVADGLPPIPTKLLEKIQRWEYIDLSMLLDGAQQEQTNFSVSHDGKLLIMGPTDRTQTKRKVISDLRTWLQAYSRMMAALVSAPSTTKEESVGLTVHLHLILQLHHDLAGSQWLRYDQEYREWAAARGIKKWGELNLTIYGRCLPSQLPATPVISTKQTYQGADHGAKGKRPAKDLRCYKWNFDGHCNKASCHFSHCCVHCGERHRATECPLVKKAK